MDGGSRIAAPLSRLTRRANSDTIAADELIQMQPASGNRQAATMGGVRRMADEKQLASREELPRCAHVKPPAHAQAKLQP
jgi:hypothetical protein